MPNHPTNGSAQDGNLKSAFSQGVVWSLLFVIASVPIFFLAAAASVTLQIDVTRVVCFPYRVISMTLVHKGLIHSENIIAAVLIGHVVPWLVVGFLFGFVRGFLRRRESLLYQTGFVTVSTVVVALLLVLTGLVLWW